MSQRFPASPLAAVHSLYSARELILQLTGREVAGRYRGSFAGLLWSFLNPLLTLAMYTFVFGVVFKARWGLQTEGTLDFALLLFAGLIVHGLVAECIGRAPHLVVGNPSYVKQVVFPLDSLPVVILGAGLFHAAISSALLLGIWLLVHGSLPMAILALPLLFLPLCLLALGLSWFLAATSVYFRDLAQIVGFVNAGLLFFSPVFYPVERVPEPFQTLLRLNPLTFVIEHFRQVLMGQGLPSLGHYLLYSALALLCAVLGYAWFQKTRPGFADVL